MGGAGTRNRQTNNGANGSEIIEEVIASLEVIEVKEVNDDTLSTA
jgi:hypothetical protein